MKTGFLPVAVRLYSHEVGVDAEDETGTAECYGIEDGLQETEKTALDEAHVGYSVVRYASGGRLVLTWDWIRVLSLDTKRRKTDQV